MKSFVMHDTAQVKRLQDFTANYPACLPPFEVVDAITPDTAPPMPEWWQESAACWAHLQTTLKTFRLGAASGEDFLIFEDDAIFSPDFEEVFTTAVNELPNGWDMFYPGGCHLDCEIYPPVQYGEHLLRGRRIHWNTCQLINKNAVARLIEFLEEPSWPCPHVTDHRFNMLHFNPTFIALSPMRFVVGQSAGTSTINGRDVPEKWGNNFYFIDWLGNKVTVRENPEGAW
jgi:hypothetical protein